MYRSLCDFSLGYARKGWHVYPVWSVDEAGVCWCKGDKRHVPPLCPHAGKHPLPSRDLFPSGYRSATVDPHAIRRGWKGTANIGLHPGPSGLIVVDVEAYGLAEWDRLAAVRGQSPTLTAITGGGGRHLFFRKPEGVGRVPSPVGCWPGIDIRADDSGLVLPPSVSGKGAYLWVDSEAPIAVCPQWVLVQGHGRSFSVRFGCE
ncbi:MAG: bifunctional DNA primase/polymerase [Gemmataceae bacterium]|nr:bifunctional DNA primase/polymerase [Gemmataceae bacterium]